MAREINMQDIEDAMKDYDPTKPLHIEDPLGIYSEDALIYDDQENSLDQYSLYSGEPIEQKDYEIIFRFPKNEQKLKKLNIIPADFSTGIIVDDKVLKILNKYCAGEFQFFPVIIKNLESKKMVPPFENRDYYLIHITKKVSAVDLIKSEFLLYDKSKGKVKGNIMGPNKLRFMANCMDDSNIAKDSNALAVKLISQRLAHVLQNEKIKGAVFVPDWLSRFDRVNQRELRPD
jgi:hypothetical protein